MWYGVVVLRSESKQGSDDYGDNLRGAGCFPGYSGNGGAWGLKPSLEAESESEPPQTYP